VTAVEVAPVVELSDWQEQHQAFSIRQETLLGKRQPVKT
jgi:hypothetical protein